MVSYNADNSLAPLSFYQHTSSAHFSLSLFLLASGERKSHFIAANIEKKFALAPPFFSLSLSPCVLNTRPIYITLVLPSLVSTLVKCCI